MKYTKVEVKTPYKPLNPAKKGAQNKKVVSILKREILIDDLNDIEPDNYSEVFCKPEIEVSLNAFYR